MERELWGAGKMSKGMQARVLRHWTFTQYGIPAEYRVAKSPLDRTPEAVRSGARLYARHCASCHGRTGLGDGQASRSLLPSPALLAYMVQRPIAVDSYLVWSISEGGVPFGTEMPAFKGQLTRNQIWEIIAFMRAGFSEHTASGKGGGAVNRP
jgi:mono/diheme cytochrome c family protein